MDDITLSELKKTLVQENYQGAISEATFDILLLKAQKDTTLSDFKEILAIINLMSKKETSDEAYYPRVIKILSIYKEKVDAMIASEDAEFEGKIFALAQFFSIFHKDSKIKTTKKPLTLNPFSQKNKAAKLISNIEDKYEVFHQKSKEIKAQSSQTALVALLDDMLAGKIMDSGLSNENKENEIASFLPIEEYPVIHGIQEDPEKIGKNKTMQFNRSNGKRSLHETFETESLKAEFLDKFPWGASMETIDKLGNALLNHTNTTLNLVGAKHPLSASMQLSLTQYILLSLDTLGKLAAYTGDKAIENFDRIHSVTSKLSETTKLLQADSHPDFEKKLSEKVAKKLQALANLNRTLSEPNPAMNGFCHINEQLAHLLLNIAYERSILTPPQPHSPYREEIEKALALAKPVITEKATQSRKRSTEPELNPSPHRKRKKQASHKGRGTQSRG